MFEFLVLHQDLIFLLIGGFFIGVISVVIGGGHFFSVPFMQWLYPTVSFGSILGNIKVSSFVRGLGSTFATRHMIEWRRDLSVGAIAIVGSVIGASIIANIDQRWLVVAVVVAIMLSESAPWIATKITPRIFHVASFLTGIYAGFFGAGIGIILIALLRLKHPIDTDIALVKVQARFVEMFLAVGAVTAHWYHGNLISSIWIPLSIGTLVGGIVGGLVLNKLSGFSGKIQSFVLRIAYLVAFLVALTPFF